MAVRHLGHQVGGGRRDDDQVGVAREPDMADIELALRVEQVGEDVLAGERADRQRRDEFCAASVMTHAHRDAALAQPADQVERFVGGDAAADDEQDAPGVSAAGARRSRRCLRRSALPGRTASAVGRRAAQDGADLVLHRAAVLRRAQPQLLLQLLVELADGEAGHAPHHSH